MSAMLQQPTLTGKIDGIISLDPTTLQCRDCGETWTAWNVRRHEFYRPAMTILLSGNQGWGFLPRCDHEKVRRCGACNAAHRAEHGEREPS